MNRIKQLTQTIRDYADDLDLGALATLKKIDDESDDLYSKIEELTNFNNFPYGGLDEG